MRYILILLLLALSIVLFGCEPDVKVDAPLSDDSVNNFPPEQPVESAKPEIKPVPREKAAITGTTVDDEAKIKPETPDTETAIETVNNTDKKPVEEIAVSTNDQIDSKPSSQDDVTSAQERTAVEEQDASSETETARTDETSEKTKSPAPDEIKAASKEKTPNTDDEQKRPQLEDTEFFKKCDYVFKNFVDEYGIVNYLELRRKKHELLAAVKELGDLPPEIRLLWSKNDEKAFLLNTHNILTINLIIENYPIKPNRWMSIWFPANSIKQIPGAREKKYFLVTGLRLTLDEIEILLLKTAKDPRYCFALSDATMMGGKLRNEAYHPDKLDKQIDEQVKKYLADSKNFSINDNNKTIHLSSIFKFESFRDSFMNSKYATIKRFRERDPDIRAFLNFIFLYIDAKTAKEIESTNYEINFQTYDWQLNERLLR